LSYLPCSTKNVINNVDDVLLILLAVTCDQQAVPSNHDTHIQGGPKNQLSEPQTFVHIFAKCWPIFKHFTNIFGGKFVPKWLLNIPPHQFGRNLPSNISTLKSAEGGSLGSL